MTEIKEHSVDSPVEKRMLEEHMPAWLEQLDRDGFTVVPNVLTPEECDAAAADFFQYLGNAGIDAETPGSRKDYPNTHGIIQHLEIGHCKAVWDVRCNPKVQAVFEEIYGTNDLLVSFDGACLMQPWHRFGKKSWAHMDQSARNTQRRCIQGYVNLTDSSDSSTGSLLVLPGSHRKFEAYFAKFPEMRAKSSGDWCKLESEEQHQFFGVEPRRVHGPKGSLVLWDSRTVHQNIAPDCGPEEAKQRLVVYTCYQPRSLISAANLKKKQKAFDEFRMSTHWPASKVKMFPKKPRTYGAPEKEYRVVRDRPNSQRVLELAGKVPMTSQRVRLAKRFLQFKFTK